MTPGQACDRCGGQPVVGLATEVCRQCDSVPLCRTCYDLHAQEARDDGTPTDRGIARLVQLAVERPDNPNEGELNP